MEAILSVTVRFLDAFEEEAVILMRALLFNNPECKELVPLLPEIANILLKVATSRDLQAAKAAEYGLSRLAKCFHEFFVRSPVSLATLQPGSALRVLANLVRVPTADPAIWGTILTLVRCELDNPYAFDCLGGAGVMLPLLSASEREFVFEAVLASPLPEAVRAAGSLAAHARGMSTTFLPRAARKLAAAGDLRALSSVLTAMESPDFTPDVAVAVWEVLGSSDPGRPRCVGQVMRLSPTYALRGGQWLLEDFDSDLAKTRWNAAAAASVACAGGQSSPALIARLISALDSDPVAKVRVRALEALASVPSRAEFGDHFVAALTQVIGCISGGLEPSGLPVDVYKRYCEAFEEATRRALCHALSWIGAADFSHIGEMMCANAPPIYRVLDEAGDAAPWREITRFYETRFASIPCSLLAQFQERAFPTTPRSEEDEPAASVR